MEPGAAPSFIPQDATTVRSSRRLEGGGLNDLFLLISIVLFIASLALGGAAFLYGQYLQSQSNSKYQQIQKAKADFNSGTIQQISRVANRIHATETILNAHIAPSAFFSALNQTTLMTVSFKTLDFETVDPTHLTIKMEGVAQSVNSIALQAELFSKNGVITNPIFSGIDRQADGVHFALVASVNPAAINYVQLVQGTQGAGVNPLPPTLPTSGSSQFDSTNQTASSSPTSGTAAQ